MTDVPARSRKASVPRPSSDVATKPYTFSSPPLAENPQRQSCSTREARSVAKTRFPFALLCFSVAAGKKSNSKKLNLVISYKVGMLSGITQFSFPLTCHMIATLDQKSTSSGIAGPYARQKLKARTGGEERTTPVTTARPEAGK